ncbi:glycosyltransferase family 4 protein [Christensenella tenuis]|uniref:Glycosyltransferase family 4 protein n=1 Tax=Christensenella tenuis TaxID=2763033 RepID=A0ABR7EFH8_9FIRM|nr:glycosyltransferase family 4 protein [Christensenella tenuis]MBC5647869.1 glycosyltransferase family 4 protein [Christensenella tenuis]
MKVLITTVRIPFITGGAEFLAWNLRDALLRHGYEAEIIGIPFNGEAPEVIEEQIVASRLFGLSSQSDLCIGLKFPAYYMPHDNKVLWILHQYRAVYDLWDYEYNGIKDHPQGTFIRDVIYRADNTYLPEAKRIYTIADNVTGRLKRFNGIQSTTLYHPCPDSERFYTGQYEDYILMPSRVNLTKRQGLALEAMEYVKSNMKLYIVGKPDRDEDYRQMMSYIEEHHLQDKVKYFDFVETEEKLRLYANARAVLFIPVDEDYGYITLEAMEAKKAVITASDSGGPLEFVENGKTGFIVEPDAADIARAIDELAASQAAARQMGEAGKQRILDMNISWDNVVRELTK